MLVLQAVAQPATPRCQPHPFILQDAGAMKKKYPKESVIHWTFEFEEPFEIKPLIAKSRLSLPFDVTEASWRQGKSLLLWTGQE